VSGVAGLNRPEAPLDEFEQAEASTAPAKSTAQRPRLDTVRA
jgi:hypothetical protein